jgi:hypothetical protein
MGGEAGETATFTTLPDLLSEQPDTTIAKVIIDNRRSLRIILVQPKGEWMWNHFKFDDIPCHFASLVDSTPENSRLTLEQRGLNVVTTDKIAADSISRICGC